MHMSSMDTNSIIVHHGTVQYSRRIPISRNLKFFEITDNSNPRRGGRGGGCCGVAATPISSDRDDRRF